MKTLLLSIIIAFTFTGCWYDKTVVLVPSGQHYPTFHTSDFSEKTDPDLDIWEESEDINGTAVLYLVSDKQDMLDYIEDNKQTRSDFNLLLRSIKNFNLQITELNTIQNAKKPQTID